MKRHRHAEPLLVSALAFLAVAEPRARLPATVRHSRHGKIGGDLDGLRPLSMYVLHNLAASSMLATPFQIRIC